MSKISGLPPFVGPFSFSDEFPVNNAGATVRGNLQQLRDFFGVGTNIIPVATYPADDQANPIYGKNGDMILALDSNNLYRKSGDRFPAVGAPTAVLQGTRVDDSIIAKNKSWSSFKIDEYVRGATSAALNFRPGDTVKTIPFFGRVLLESLRVSMGTDGFALRLLLSSGAEVVAISGTAAACVGQISIGINGLSPAQVSAGYNIEITASGAGTTTALLRTIPIA